MRSEGTSEAVRVSGSEARVMRVPVRVRESMSYTSSIPSNFHPPL